ncbi:MAG: 2-oxoglutarate dehydrogenase E1 component [Bacteroidetes bacterium GWA2_30_7]|nr:MAG: 2-oxoglutarate dehydrogenase E1 component [Bacteroidetes bacterium GWA2_30_7]
MDLFSYLQDIKYVESLFQKYSEDNNSVDESWKSFFEGFEFALKNYPQKHKGQLVDTEFKVINLINAYRQRGHFFTKTNPVRARRIYSPTLDLENFELSNTDLNSTFRAGNEIGIGNAKLLDIVAHLQQTYCHSIGVEYMYIRQPEVVQWLQNKMEISKNTPTYSTNIKKEIFQNLVQAVNFETFIHRKFVGQKRFSLEGAESLIPSLSTIIKRGAAVGTKEFIIGMAHRGRLNILANILEKPVVDIFDEFNGKEYDEENLLGDVKYHLGYENEICVDDTNKVKVTLVPNPSHLETVNGVTQGIARAKLLNKYNEDYNKLVPILIHGDAAIAAQGIVYEVIQMSQLAGFKTGGTMHLVINNQIGFTTNYIDARSSTYCTDIGKVIRAPIFHVNGDDVEALVYTIELAMEYRQQFHTDVFIDILCYRRYGHNEGDEPRFTQPTLYKDIANHPNPKEIYKKQLIAEGVIDEGTAKKIENEYIQQLELSLNNSKKAETVKVKHFMAEEWKDFEFLNNGEIFNKIETSITEKVLRRLAKKITTLPEGKKFFNKIEKLMSDRAKMIESNKLDWAMGELLAYASLVTTGIPVRISGQDTERGTFSHRHATLVIEDTDQQYTYLKYVDENQASFHAINSLLSEYGVLGFEYGYSLAIPKGLTIWEAQFGDFANVAQVIIDQYISSAHDKWSMMNGLVLLLPHGYEGQGPEHSSARVERYLSMCANNNMQVADCTTPANLFHILRRQVMRNFRLPLIIFTPKSLLRHPLCTSTIQDFTEGSFKEIIDDNFVRPEQVKQLILCSGKIYYELFAKREALNDSESALIRIEQIYPFNMVLFKTIHSKYKNSERLIWVQEEPENMGAWTFISKTLCEFALMPVLRPASGSPAEGLFEQHKLRQNKILDKAFKLCKCDSVMKYCGMKCTV